MAIFHTDSLFIRTFEPDDLADIHRILESAFGADPPQDTTPALRERESWLRWSILNQAWFPNLHQPPYGDLAVVLRSTDRLIGAVGYVPLLAPFDQIPELRTADRPRALYTPEVGLFWVIDPPHQRQGYALEAARALVIHGFQDLHLLRILATTEYGNTASQGVMRGLGMHIARNPLPTPDWLQIVGILNNPV